MTKDKYKKLKTKTSEVWVNFSQKIKTKIF